MIIKNMAGETLLTTPGSSLRSADLRENDLTGANLTEADLTGANLTEADLYVADLTGANLTEADLYGADLTGANLTEANLTRAYLWKTNLTGAIMPDGRTWEAYRTDPLAGICEEPEARDRAISAWNSHSWRNCPMHTAYGWTSIEDAPETKRLLVSAFVALFDSELLRDRGYYRCHYRRTGSYPVSK